MRDGSIIRQKYEVLLESAVFPTFELSKLRIVSNP